MTDAKRGPGRKPIRHDPRDPLHLWKHTQRVSERDFADNLQPGEIFATSQTSTVGHIRAQLGVRGLTCRRVPPETFTPQQRARWRRHWAVWRVVQRDSGPIGGAAQSNEAST